MEPWVSLAVGCALALGTAWGAPPTNDACSNAEVVPGDGPFPYLTSIVPDITEATTAGDPDAPSCGFDGHSRSVWYVFTPEEDGLYTFSLGDDTATSVLDTVMTLYSAPGCSGPWTEEACNDDSGAAHNRSGFSAELTAGVTYYAVVWNFFDEAPIPPFTAVQLRVSRPEVPANDTCAGAMAIPSNGPFPYLTPVVDTVLATEAGDPTRPTCFPAFNRRSVWYAFTPVSSGIYSISTCRDTATTVVDTTLGLYRSTGGCAGTWVEVGCDANGCGDRAIITAPLMAGTNYYIVVWDVDPDPVISATDVQLKITVPPEAVTLPAAMITSTTAVLNGYLRPNGLLTRYWMEYGPTTNYAFATSRPVLFGSTIEAYTNFLVTGLSPGTVYHYRMVATNDNGAAYGLDRTFAFSTNSPVITHYVGPVDGAFQLRFTGATDQIYRVNASSNLTVWQDLGVATPLGGGQFEFEDGDAGEHRMRFYRVVSP